MAAILFGDTLGHSTDTDLITLASGIATVAGEISVTTLDIGGTNVTTTAAELNKLDGDTGATGTTLVAGDRVVVNDNGTIVQVAMSDFETFMEANLDTMGSQFTSASSLATIGTIGTGVWQGTAVASGYLDSDTAHLTTIQTFTGAKTFSADATFTGDTNTFSSSNSADPLVVIKNTTDDAAGARLRFVKDKGGAGADGDDIGVIEFVGDDANQEQTHFAKIYAEVGEADNTDEAGKLTIQVASSNGTTTGLENGIVLTGHKTSDYVDVALGTGTSSTVTIAGHLTVTGTTTTINSTTLTVADDLITVSKGNDTVANADGSGMEIDVTGGTNLFWKYVHSNTALSSNVDIDVASGKVYKVAGANTLSATTLGSAVVASSLTSVGTLTALQVDNINLNGNAITSSTAADLVINCTDGQSVVVEGLDIDDGVVTGASSITSTNFVGIIGASGAAAGTFTTCDATTDFTIDGLVLTADTITNDAALTVVSTGLTLNASLDIALSADGGNVTMDDGSTTVFDFNTDDPELKIMDDAQVANYLSIAVGANGETTIQTVDYDAAAANLTITADGTFEAIGTTITLDSGGNIALEPAGGSHIKLDDVIQVDSGVVTGATSITSTAFLGTLDGVVGGNTAAAGTFTTLTANDQLVVAAGAAITGDTTDEITLNVKGVGSQSVAHFNVELSDGTDKLTVSSAGVTTAASLVATTADINAGTVDATIGATTPAAGTFTTLDCTNGAFDLLNLHIDGGTDIGAAIIDADLMILDDGANGTNRKCAMSRVKTYINAVSLSDANTFTADQTIGGATPKLTIGDAGAEDASIVFDGNALDWHIGLDDAGNPNGQRGDSAVTRTDVLSIGIGDTLGTTDKFTLSQHGHLMLQGDSGQGVAPGLTILDTNTATGGSTSYPILHITKNDTSANPDGTFLGHIHFRGANSAGNERPFGMITSKVVDNTADAEKGTLELLVQTVGATYEQNYQLTSGFLLTGGTGTIVNATIGSHADSIVTLPGGLSIGGGYGSTGTSITEAGVFSTNGASTLAGAVAITDSTTASNSTTGALKVTGGISTQGDIYVGDDLTVGDDLNVGDDLLLTSEDAAAYWGDGNDIAIFHSSAGFGLNSTGHTNWVNGGSVKNLPVSANSLVIANKTSDGDISFAVNAGGSTETLLHLDAAESKVYLGVDTTTDTAVLGGLTVGTNGGGTDATFYGAASNEKLFWDASENSLQINDSDGTAIVTMGGDANDNYAISIQNQADESGRVLANAYITHSDGRLKKDILPMNNAMDKLNKLQGVTYNWKAGTRKAKGWRSQEFGFIAQDVQKVLPQITNVGKDGHAHGIDYSKLTAVLTEAVKQQDVEIKNLRTTLSTVLKSQELLLEKLGIKK